MAPFTAFECLNFNPFIANDSLNDNSQDPDVNFFHDNVSPLNTYISPDDFSGNFKDFTENFILSPTSQRYTNADLKNSLYARVII